uniref:Methyltransferase type 12 n=1 Tax=Cyanothece sp. (strain PCC 7425 / ATCC 29141) TaxID=395961 RepID=B8HVG1_CYAP4
MDLPSLDRTTSPKDLMYHSDPQNYFFWGGSALDSVQEMLELAGKTSIRALLDLPSGYGRELRFFKVAFPQTEITACDIDQDAVNFCVETFNVKGVYSNSDPLFIPITDQFDLIWCGSLFTHFGAENWHRLLHFCRQRLEIDGILIFATHGSFVAEFLRDGLLDLDLDKKGIQQILENFDICGFGYTDYFGQLNYGISLSSAAWVNLFLQQWPELKYYLIKQKGGVIGMIHSHSYAQDN